MTRFIAAGLAEMIIGSEAYDHYHPGIDNAVNALACLGAIAGFWLVYTGRLARLFRKV